jgi:heat-inducible transcriptional repressor
MQNDDIVLSGEDKIFNYPEFEDVDRLKNFLTVISSKDKLASLLKTDNDITINVKIGSDEENKKNEVPSDCSVVTATYSVGNKNLGTYGVIGPVRMDYSKVISVLENVGKVLEIIIDKKGGSNGKQ